MNGMRRTPEDYMGFDFEDVETYVQTDTPVFIPVTVMDPDTNDCTNGCESYRYGICVGFVSAGSKPLSVVIDQETRRLRFVPADVPVYFRLGEDFENAADSYLSDWQDCKAERARIYEERRLRYERDHMHE